jgi:FlaA1/EpsC-like NDP-sugar epimerase
MTNIKLIPYILNLPRITKRLIVLITDMGLCALTVWLAFFLLLGEWTLLSEQAQTAIFTSFILTIPVFNVFGLYRAIFRSSEWQSILAIIRATSAYGILYAALIFGVGFKGIPPTIGLIQPILLVLAVGASRTIASYWLSKFYRPQLELTPIRGVLIYGAGTAGKQLLAMLRQNKEMKVLGFLDDNIKLQGQSLNGVTIYNPSDLPNLLQRLSVNDILLALPSVSRYHRNQILDSIAKLKISVRTIPSLNDLTMGKLVVNDLRELDIEDLLWRDPVEPNFDLLKKNIYQKVVVVTGAGGSIGGELCRQILTQLPKKLILIDQNEFSLYSISEELQINFRNIDHLNGTLPLIVPILASVYDESTISSIFLNHSPEIIFHAAAYKHVHLVESNFTQGILNNTYGTICLAKVAVRMKVSKFILISTDKAVRPTSIMGASKRIAELVLQAMAADKVVCRDTNFSMVRFGNVLDSSGSVVPLFRRQIKQGGPITLTHPEVVRFFMTITEAAQLVIQSSSMAKGGDLFILDMGKPVKIYDLALRMVELSGLKVRDNTNPHGDIEIKITGLRSGEKLYEELLICDKHYPTAHPLIMSAQEQFIPLGELDLLLSELKEELSKHSLGRVKSILKKIVPDYSPS